MYAEYFPRVLFADLSLIDFSWIIVTVFLKQQLLVIASDRFLEMRQLFLSIFLVKLNFPGKGVIILYFCGDGPISNFLGS